MIPIAEPDLSGNELKYLSECVKTNWVSSAGDFIKRFERKFADICGARHAASCSNGTVALHLAMEALDIGPGDEVIVPNLTFAATANAVMHAGATPVLADIERKSWNIDPKEIQRRITAKTKAVIPVHLYGNPCDMDAIMKIARKHDLSVIEDCAEAHGALYKGKHVGSIGHIGCFSFYGNKIITTGEGGMCITDDEALLKRINLLKNHGMDPERKYWHPVVGYNYRMTNMQAAVGLAQLERFDSLVGRKREIASWYNKGLKELAEDGLVELHPEVPGTKGTYWLYSILLTDSFGMSRDELAARLRKKDIETRPLFYPLNIMPPYNTGEHFPVSEDVAARGITLPSSTTLKRDEVQRVVDAIAGARG